jgi:hypothetical protein
VFAQASKLGRFLDFSAIAVFSLVSSIAVARVGLEPRGSVAAVGVVFSPWTAETEALSRAAAAGARFLRFGGSSFVVVVAPDSDRFVERVKELGAVLVVDASIVTACLPQSAGAPEKP